MKRCIIDLPKIRISAPGYDVDTAAPENMIFHEDFLFSQPYYFGFVACPFAGYTGKDTKIQFVNVAVPDITDNPLVLLYAVSPTPEVIFPAARSKGAGNDQDGYNVMMWGISYTIVNSTTISVRFEKSGSVRLSPDGAHMVLMKRPT